MRTLGIFGMGLLWAGSALAGNGVLTLDDSSFEQEVLRSDVPVLVNFCADWCGPCKALAPHVEELADDFEGRLRIGKIDIDHSPLPVHYGIRGVPTNIVFKDGVPVGEIVGAVSEMRLESFANDALAGRARDPSGVPEGESCPLPTDPARSAPTTATREATPTDSPRSATPRSERTGER